MPEAFPALIVPLLLTPPLKEETLSTNMPVVSAVMLPVLRMPPAKVETVALPKRDPAPTRMPAAPDEMVPLLLSRLMDLNDVQEGVINICFRVADEQGLVILDLKDLRAVLGFISDHAAELTVQYGNVSKATIGSPRNPRTSATISRRCKATRTPRPRPTSITASSAAPPTSPPAPSRSQS